MAGGAYSGQAAGRGGGFGAMVVVLLLLLTLATAKSADPSLYPPAPDKGVTLYLVDNGWHSDIALPRAELIGAGGPLAQAAGETTNQPWVLVGWGDARFYRESGWSAHRVLDAMRALFGQDNQSVVHLEGLAARPDLIWREGVHAIRVSPAGLRALEARLDGSFARGARGEPQMAAGETPPDEAFFESGERFSLAHLCNHWTADLLHAAGLPVTPVIDTLPAGLWLDLKVRAEV
ncbi:MAG: DUF2459 domain-containing protein [Caulobacterales bacterium]